MWLLQANHRLSKATNSCMRANICRWHFQSTMGYADCHPLRVDQDPWSIQGMVVCMQDDQRVGGFVKLYSVLRPSFRLSGYTIVVRI